MRWLLGAAEYMPLGRWCHRTSPAYARTCNQGLKAQQSIEDHSLCTGKGVPRREEAKDNRPRRACEDERDRMAMKLFFNGTL